MTSAVAPIDTPSTARVTPQAFRDAAQQAAVKWYHCLVPGLPRKRLTRAANMYAAVAATCTEPYVRAHAACRAYNLTPPVPPPRSSCVCLLCCCCLAKKRYAEIRRITALRATRQKEANEAVLKLRDSLNPTMTLCDTLAALYAPELYALMRYEQERTC
jgi:hypothetical protein